MIFKNQNGRVSVDFEKLQQYPESLWTVMASSPIAQNGEVQVCSDWNMDQLQLIRDFYDGSKWPNPYVLENKAMMRPDFLGTLIYDYLDLPDDYEEVHEEVHEEECPEDYEWLDEVDPSYYDEDDLYDKYEPDPIKEYYMGYDDYRGT